MKTPKQLIDEMIEAGLCQQDIVNKTNISKASISELRSGVKRNTSYALVCKLIELHKKVMRKHRKARRVVSTTE